MTQNRRHTPTYAVWHLYGRGIYARTGIVLCTPAANTNHTHPSSQLSRHSISCDQQWLVCRFLETLSHSRGLIHNNNGLCFRLISYTTFSVMKYKTPADESAVGWQTGRGPWRDSYSLVQCAAQSSSLCELVWFTFENTLVESYLVDFAYVFRS